MRTTDRKELGLDHERSQVGTRPMRTLALLLFTFLVFVLSGPVYSASFTPLGDLPGGIFGSIANGISADGTTVVGRSDTSSGYEAFNWDATNGMQGLGTLSGSSFSEALGVSGDGATVVGFGGNAGDTRSVALLWDATNGIRSLGDLPGGIVGSVAMGISADGTTAAGWNIISSNPLVEEAAIWDTTNGNIQGLGDLPGGIFFSQAFGISADGSTIVGRSRSTSGPEAFIWDATNGMQGLGDLPGGAFVSFATAASSDGATVVGRGTSALGPQEAFIWDAVNGMRGLGDLPGGRFVSQATGVSANGTTVVGLGETALGQEAFIWDATNGMQSLQFLLSSLGVELTGWQLRQARGISTDGNTIVGFGTNPNGFTEAFVAVIPEPGTAVLLGLGLAGLGMRRRVS